MCLKRWRMVSFYGEPILLILKKQQLLELFFDLTIA